MGEISIFSLDADALLLKRRSKYAIDNYLVFLIDFS